MIWGLVLEIIGLVPLLILVALVLWKKRQLDREERRDPILTELRVLPAHSLRERQDKIVETRIDNLIYVLTVGLLTALFISSRRIDMATLAWDWLDILFIVLAIGSALYFGRRVTRDMPLQLKYRQGIRAEQAVAQELAASLAGDNRIIHDIQAGEFNIDHVVITPVGVFAVETKSRLKPPAGNGSPRVKYDGKRLEFPGWSETKPIEQAARQAKWLADYLQKSTGETFPVFAVLALPGWFIDYSVRVTEQMVRVINPKNSGWLLLPGKQPIRLDPPAIQRAAFQIEKLAQVPAPE
ncbi:nuclease-related domain-containing protein [Quatrionicoccus australiensis]|uniref:nuclease-related domain-containing protein n=1 Tax=Quatrionicoccus australiensis TaxID=138118 RepID=UPI001CF8E08B|nr:nuclease-related domain-containing protein [Quatrionicoccus australiensis]UCV14155.1 NERD domain-containing protein [Quatrionicoccus australiensis]